MTKHLRLIMLVLVLSYSLLVGPESGFAGQAAGRAESNWFKAHLFQHRVFVPHRVHAPRLESLGVRAVDYARHLLGVPYRYGGDSPGNGFDCSGFVRFVWDHFGFHLPHSSYADFGLGRSVARASLQPGDLVFFVGVGHVGLYVGSGRFIHAPHTGTSVQITSLNDPWYRTQYDGARRIVVAKATTARRHAGRATFAAMRAIAKHPDGRVA